MLNNPSLVFPVVYVCQSKTFDINTEKLQILYSFVRWVHDSRGRQGPIKNTYLFSCPRFFFFISSHYIHYSVEHILIRICGSFFLNMIPSRKSRQCESTIYTIYWNCWSDIPNFLYLWYINNLKRLLGTS